MGLGWTRPIPEKQVRRVRQVRWVRRCAGATANGACGCDRCDWADGTCRCDGCDGPPCLECDGCARCDAAIGPMDAGEGAGAPGAEGAIGLGPAKKVTMGVTGALVRGRDRQWDRGRRVRQVRGCPGAWDRRVRPARWRARPPSSAGAPQFDLLTAAPPLFRALLRWITVPAGVVGSPLWRHREPGFGRSCARGIRLVDGVIQEFGEARRGELSFNRARSLERCRRRVPIPMQGLQMMDMHMCAVPNSRVNAGEHPMPSHGTLTAVVLKQ